jgi:hypothetical protein
MTEQAKDSLEPHFKFLYDVLKDNYSDYSYYVFSTTSAILLIIGWLLTSKDARNYISEHTRIKTWMFVGIAFFFTAEIFFSCRAKSRSDEIADLLAQMKDPTISTTTNNVYPATYYSSKTVPWRGVVWFDAAHAVLYVILVRIIYSIRPHSGKSS